MAINFERLVSRGVAAEMSRLLDMADMKTSVNTILELMILGFFAIFIATTFALYIVKFLAPALEAVIGFAAGAVYVALIYSMIVYRTDVKKAKMEALLPDYFMVASSNLRSGIALDRSLLLAARPEFGFFAEEVKEMNRKIMGGSPLESALKELASRYHSNELTHAVRMMIEAIKYGGEMADLLEQLSKEMRQQQIVQKEITGQLFLYTILIIMAGVIAAPALYGLTSMMINLVDKVWAGILAQNPGGLPSSGISFLKPTPPQISDAEYNDFAIVAIIIITAFASLIVSAISKDSVVQGLKYLPIFIIVGLMIFFVVQFVVNTYFVSGVSASAAAAGGI